MHVACLTAIKGTPLAGSPAELLESGGGSG